MGLPSVSTLLLHFTLSYGEGDQREASKREVVGFPASTKPTAMSAIALRNIIQTFHPKFSGQFPIDISVPD
jgi:hypothetical protein